VDAQSIYRTFRPSTLDLALKHGVPIETALLALARAASECPSSLAHSEIAQYVRARIEDEVLREQLRETG
jgi:hypothetical protein